MNTSEETALGLMRSAWATRRSSLGLAAEARQRALRQAREDLISAAAMLREEGPTVSYAHAVHLLANVELDVGHEARALALWEEAVSVLRGTEAVLQLAHKVRHLGDLHRHCDRLEQAEACYAEALTLYREHDDSGSLDFANAFSRMAELKERQGERPQALALWRRTRDLYADVGILAGVEEADRHIAELAEGHAGSTRKDEQ